MHSNYRNRFQKTNDFLYSPKLQSIAALNNPHHFTRKRKMPLADLIVSTLSKKGLTTTMELVQYFIQKGDDFMNLSKQGYLQQRKRLNYHVFSFLNREYLQDFYQSEEPILWNGYLVLAVDGTKAEVPNSEENRTAFGESRNHTDQTATRALVSCIFDVWNHFFLDLQIASIQTSESELAKNNIKAMNEIVNSHPCILLFDRGYPSIEFRKSKSLP